MEDTNTPQQLCQQCMANITAFLPFLKLCKQSVKHWTFLSENLINLSAQKTCNTAFVFVNDRFDKVTTVFEKRDRNKNKLWHVVTKRINQLQSARKTRESRDSETTKLGKLLYTCVECGAKFNRMNKINNHLANQGKRLCAYCHEIINLKAFGEHLESHSIPFYTCKTCFLPFECKYRLIKHKRVHQGRIMCGECKKTFPLAHYLNIHVNRIHERAFCDKCNKIFSNRICFNKHQSKCKSKKQEKYICDHCSKEFPEKGNIRLHINKMHSKIMSHQCEVCGKKFNSACHLDEHKESHNVVPDRYVCPFCGGQYSSSGGYRKHLRQKHYRTNPELKMDMKCTCDVCDVQFISFKNHQNHLRSKKHKEKVKEKKLLELD